MKTYLYQSGKDALTAQDGQPTKMVITGFKASDTADFTFNAATNTLPGTVVFTGAESDIYYIPVNDDEVMLQCIIPKTADEMTIGSLQLLVDDTPFCVSIAPSTFLKLEQVPGESVGTYFVYQLLINIPGLVNRFSFVNLNVRAAAFKEETSELTMTRWPWEEAYDQLVIGTHTQTGAAAFVLNAWNDYWGNPLLVNNATDARFWRLDGGVSGDRHLYNQGA